MTALVTFDIMRDVEGLAEVSVCFTAVDVSSFSVVCCTIDLTVVVRF